MSSRAEPPGEWRGPASGLASHPPSFPAAPSRPGESDAWTPRGPPPSHWGAGQGDGPPSHWGAPPGFPVPGKPPFEQASNGAIADRAFQEPAVGNGAVGSSASEPPLPAVPTPVERLKRIRVVASALSEQMLEKLSSLGVSSSRKGHSMAETHSLPGTSTALKEAQCARLGLTASSASTQRSKLPPPGPAMPRLLACTLGLAHSGLWERFRQRCGTPLPDCLL